jgi:hypothetical protein
MGSSRVASTIVRWLVASAFGVGLAQAVAPSGQHRPAEALLRVPAEFSIAMVHVGPDGCGRVAFYMRPAADGTPLWESARARNPDGTRPYQNSAIKCWSCGRGVGRGAPWLSPRARAR